MVRRERSRRARCRSARPRQWAQVRAGERRPPGRFSASRCATSAAASASSWMVGSASSNSARQRQSRHGAAPPWGDLCARRAARRSALQARARSRPLLPLFTAQLSAAREPAPGATSSGSGPAGRSILARAEPALSPRAPRTAAQSAVDWFGHPQSAARLLKRQSCAREAQRGTGRFSEGSHGRGAGDAADGAAHRGPRKAATSRQLPGAGRATRRCAQRRS